MAWLIAWILTLLHMVIGSPSTNQNLFTPLVEGINAIATQMT